eukprot:607794-Rhodomonas_salina.1
MQEEKQSNSTAQAKRYWRRNIAPPMPAPNITEGEQQGEAMMPLKLEGKEHGEAIKGSLSTPRMRHVTMPG